MPDMDDKSTGNGSHPFVTCYSKKMMMGAMYFSV